MEECKGLNEVTDLSPYITCSSYNFYNLLINAYIYNDNLIWTLIIHSERSLTYRTLNSLILCSVLNSSACQLTDIIYIYTHTHKQSICNFRNCFYMS